MIRWSHELRGWIFTPTLSERRIRTLEWSGHANDYIDWFDFNDAYGFFHEGAD
jgi:hypothetical protein